MAARTSTDRALYGVPLLIEGAGDLIEVAADFSVFSGQPANGRQQFIIDRGNGNAGANSRPCDGLPDKFGLAHIIVFQPFGKVGVFFLGHASFDHMTAVGRVVFFLQALTSFLARRSRGPRASPAKRVAWGEDERRNE